MKKNYDTKQSLAIEKKLINGQYDDYNEFENACFEQLDNDWDVPVMSDQEIALLYRMGRTYAEIMIENAEKKGFKPNKLYNLLFKLRMLTETEEDEEEEE